MPRDSRPSASPKDDLHNCGWRKIPALLVRLPEHESAAIVPADGSHCRSLANAVVKVIAAAQDDLQQ
jgi:hypothetical protein